MIPDLPEYRLLRKLRGPSIGLGLRLGLTGAGPNGFIQRMSQLKAAIANAYVYTDMASPPTVSVGATGANSTLRSVTPAAPTVRLGDATIRYVGGNWIENSAGSYYRPYSVSTGGGSVKTGCPGGGFEFMTDAPAFDFSLRGSSSSSPKYRMYVDEGAGWRLVTSAGSPATTNGDFPAPGTDNAFYYIKVTFSGAATRRIRVLFNGGASTTVNVYGINVTTGYSVSLSAARTPVIAGIGDSFTVGTQDDYLNGQWIHRLAELMGCEGIALGAGGTGYATTTGSFALNIASRLSLDISAYDPALVIIWAGINDYDKVAGTVQTNLTAGLAALRVQLPNTPIMVVGSNDASSRNVPTAIKAAIKASWTASLASYGHSIFTNDYSIPASLYTIIEGADALHPNQAGYDSYASQMLTDINAWLATV